jgi:hypothetical protein
MRHDRPHLSFLIRVISVTGAAALIAAPSHASVSPEGSEMIMADWMLMSFLSFAGAALAVFLVAVRRGLFRNMEDAKYYLLSVQEPDYYTPAWAREEHSDAA